MSVRNEIHAFINGIDESKLIALRPLLLTLLEDSVAIETDMTTEEIAIIDAGLEAHRRGEVVRHEDIDWDAPPAQV